MLTSNRQILQICTYIVKYCQYCQILISSNTALKIIGKSHCLIFDVIFGFRRYAVPSLTSFPQ